MKLNSSQIIIIIFVVLFFAIFLPMIVIPSSKNISPTENEVLKREVYTEDLEGPLARILTIKVKTYKDDQGAYFANFYTFFGIKYGSSRLDYDEL